MKQIKKMLRTIERSLKTKLKIVGSLNKATYPLILVVPGTPPSGNSSVGRSL